MPDLNPLWTLLFEVLFFLIIWTMLFDPTKNTDRVRLGVYIAGVVFAFLVGVVALLIDARAMGLFG